MGEHILGCMQIKEVSCRTALSKSRLPSLDYALNPYRGCQHACLYCYSPEVLRETRPWGGFLDVKRNIPLVLAKELKRKERGVVGIGTVTDAYQPIERKYELTRRCLEQLLKHDFPISIQTKSSLVVRDLDLIKRFSEKDVGVTLTTIDEDRAKLFEPFASPPKDRLSAIFKFSLEGIDTWVFIGPILPSVTDAHLDELIEEITKAGVKKVIIDKLRLRGHIWDNIEKALKNQNEGLVKNLRAMLKDQYFRKVEKKIAELCEDNNIKLESAFGSRRL